MLPGVLCSQAEVVDQVLHKVNTYNYEVWPDGEIVRCRGYLRAQGLGPIALSFCDPLQAHIDACGAMMC